MNSEQYDEGKHTPYNIMFSTTPIRLIRAPGPIAYEDGAEAETEGWRLHDQDPHPQQPPLPPPARNPQRPPPRCRPSDRSRREGWLASPQNTRAMNDDDATADPQREERVRRGVYIRASRRDHTAVTSSHNGPAWIIRMKIHGYLELRHPHGYGDIHGLLKLSSISTTLPNKARHLASLPLPSPTMDSDSHIDAESASNSTTDNPGSPPSGSGMFSGSRCQGNPHFQPPIRPPDPPIQPPVGPPLSSDVPPAEPNPIWTDPRTPHGTPHVIVPGITAVHYAINEPCATRS
ncbi:hypothetical protein B0H19DRAFT_1375065 [Mycena capillaripes]|nr:hypothetical protein B0H19DRAFT_1375065 [Mycena capillaripes]